MNKQQFDEIKRVMEQAAGGDYQPLYIISGLIVFFSGLIVLLLIYIYKNDKQIKSAEVKEMKERQERQDRLIEGTNKLTTQNSKLIAVHEAEIKHIKHTA